MPLSPGREEVAYVPNIEVVDEQNRNEETENRVTEEDSKLADEYQKTKSEDPTKKEYQVEVQTYEEVIKQRKAKLFVDHSANQSIEFVKGLTNSEYDQLCAESTEVKTSSINNRARCITGEDIAADSNNIH